MALQDEDNASRTTLRSTIDSWLKDFFAMATVMVPWLQDSKQKTWYNMMIQKATRDWHRLRKIIVHTSTNRWKSCICIDALQNLLGKMWKWLASDNLGRFVRHCPELPISDQVRLDSNVGDYLNEIKDVKRVDFHMIWHDFTEKQKDTSITSICDRDHDGVAEQRARIVCFGTALVRSYSFCLQEHFQMQCLLSLVSELTLCWSFRPHFCRVLRLVTRCEKDATK